MLLVFVLGTPALLLAIEAGPSATAFGWSTLTSRDDGTLALAVIGTVAWVAWGIFSASIILELVARVRGVRAPHLPGLAVPQMASARLVGAASLLFIALPTLSAVTAAVNTPRADAAPAPVHVPATRPMNSPTPAVAPSSPPTATSTPASAGVSTAIGAATAHVDETSGTEAYTVRRGDSLWKIAKERLGDGTRYVELVDLNRGVLNGRPDFLTPGTVLRVPSVNQTDDSRGERPSEDLGGDLGRDLGETTYVVQPGDTLSEIANKTVGDATAYPRLYRASIGTPQPDGAHLTDPDLIRPGWHITIPANDPTEREGSPASPDPEQELGPPPSPGDARPGFPPPPPPTTAAEAEPTRSSDAVVSQHDDDRQTPGWLLPGLTAGGAGLAGALLIALRQHRRTQQRYRRPGRILQAPPTELRATEKSIHASGSLTAPRIEDMDRALRALSATHPSVGIKTARLSDTLLSLELDEADHLPSPWQGANTTWTLDLRDQLAPEADDDADIAAPCPLLVSIGQTSDGSLVFVNLERLRVVTLTGDRQLSEALGRHIAAELSLNPWSRLVEIDTLGIGAELVEIDPLRMRHHADGDTAFLEQIGTDLESEDPHLEPDRFRAVVASAELADPGIHDKVATIVTSHPRRPGATIITIGGQPSAHSAVVHLSQGRLRIETVGLDLIAAGLTSEEAAACAALVDITRDYPTNIDIPASPAEANGSRVDPNITVSRDTTATDAAGALAAALTQPRPVGPAGEGSLLPLDAAGYEHSAATTADDIDRLAPLATDDAANAIRESDPTLDDDLARWEAPVVLVPQLTLLGPANARTAGDAKQVARRKPYYVEMLAYLALHPQGASAAEVADAFGIRVERARTDLSVLRHWLGNDPTTGQPHLPSARSRKAPGEPGGAKYALQGVLTDFDLFRRLRARGQSRGAHGIDDLVQALRLVAGEPFSQLRAEGWTWLLDGDRLDHIATCAVVDVAHIVTTHALAIEDLELARFSAETSHHAAPYDETGRLDLITVAAATGHTAAAERQITNGILLRTDDHLGPVELPERSAALLRSRSPKRHTGEETRP
ncbi:LysM peptidoglycan-binding domain-containing protein [Nocardioides carbamazepini]|uniref:LysM peptidoglycan-binding domain-containing protein n=1 Tax=Nocardioides carbamazepini TaxID=2854259 RepID=UPI00214A4E84|nr:LysM peptidoglycan-binding domain-containing protein [Nocardioides carbamazepini]MCR1785880.1 LysM peptidoglycan-binding domain-containing protein [Nocardioides carbamazepini]